MELSYRSLSEDAGRDGEREATTISAPRTMFMLAPQRAVQSSTTAIRLHRSQPSAALCAGSNQKRRSLRSSRRSERRWTPCATTATVPTVAAVRGHWSGPNHSDAAHTSCGKRHVRFLLLRLPAARCPRRPMDCSVPADVVEWRLTVAIPVAITTISEPIRARRELASLH
jgi:hypothetical protein